MNLDGRMDIITARAKSDLVTGRFKGELVWLEQPAQNPLGDSWEMVFFFFFFFFNIY